LEISKLKFFLRRVERHDLTVQAKYTLHNLTKSNESCPCTSVSGIVPAPDIHEVGAKELQCPPVHDRSRESFSEELEVLEELILPDLPDAPFAERSLIETHDIDDSCVAVDQTITAGGIPQIGPPTVSAWRPKLAGPETNSSNRRPWPAQTWFNPIRPVYR
jgi:hypothetical protein